MNCDVDDKVVHVIDGAVIGEIVKSVVSASKDYTEIKVRGCNNYCNKISKALLSHIGYDYGDVGYVLNEREIEIMARENSVLNLGSKHLTRIDGDLDIRGISTRISARTFIWTMLSNVYVENVVLDADIRECFSWADCRNIELVGLKGENIVGIGMFRGAKIYDELTLRKMKIEGIDLSECFKSAVIRRIDISGSELKISGCEKVLGGCKIGYIDATECSIEFTNGEMVKRLFYGGDAEDCADIGCINLTGSTVKMPAGRYSRARVINSKDRVGTVVALNTRVDNLDEFKRWLRQCNVARVETNVKEIKEAFEDVQSGMTH